MAINLKSLAAEFKQRAASSSVDFKGEEGNWQTDSDPCFSSISRRFQDRGYIEKEELRKIGRWKVQGGRIDRHLRENSSLEIREQSERAFSASDDATRIAALSELKGVRVPVASSILAM